MKFIKSSIQSKRHSFALFLLFSFGFLFLFSSCSEDEEENPMEEESYFPLTVGSTWTYQNSNGENEVNTLTDRTKNVGGFTWNIITLEPNTADEELLVRIDAATQKVYYGYDFTDNEGVLFVTAVADLDAEVGDSWTDTFEDDGASLTYTMTLQEKDVKKTLNGKNYDNLMTVRVEGRFTPIVDGLTINNSTWYFARGIGIVAVEYEDGAYSRLIDYSIK